MSRVNDVLAIIGALYALLTAVGNACPKTKVGKFCAKVALVLRAVE